MFWWKSIFLGYKFFKILDFDEGCFKLMCFNVGDFLVWMEYVFFWFFVVVEWIMCDNIKWDVIIIDFKDFSILGFFLMILKDLLRFVCLIWGVDFYCKIRNFRWKFIIVYSNMNMWYLDE